ncbi:hypothetical protein F5Y16DRAFT_403080 [Xylariaceae sp. FL0255]|nr:hypothetical protein F5Y16DRAFT_403080 [Xylariaceae sp. FL0255]
MSSNRQQDNAAQCLVAAGLKARVYLPTDVVYTERSESYWCNSARLRPGCIFQPTSVDEVAVAVKALADAQQNFAVRSGGRMNWSGSNDIDGGGGSNNFSIVTQFVMRTFLNSAFWGGFVICPMDSLPAAREAVSKFTTGSQPDLDSTLNLAICHNAQFGGALIVALCTNVAGVENAAAFGRISKMPQTVTNLKMTSMAELITYASFPTGFYNIWYTICVKNDTSIITKAAELYASMASRAEEKVSDGDFTSHCSLKPIPTEYVTNGSGAAGENMLGLERYPHDAVLMQASISVRTPELAEWARPEVRRMIQGVQDFAESVPDGLCPWLYLNYANPEQEVLQSYGPENLDKMRKVASKYDPYGVFQRLCPGGFKISNVKT